MVTLREYQIEAIKCIDERFKKDFRQYIEMPTGSGKTITFLSYAKTHHFRVLIIVPSRQLLNQVYESALLFYQPWEISRKGNGFDEKIMNIHICIINSIRGDYLEEISQENFGVIIIDEAHHSQSESYKRIIKRRMQNGIDDRILGVTATPDRADGQLLKDLLGACSFKLEIMDMIAEGNLCDIEGFNVKTNIDLSDIDDHNGDFSIRQLYNKLCTENRNKMILDICKNEMKERKTLIFCINIDHSKKINKLLNENGISSAHIDGTMNTIQKNSILTSFRNGEVAHLCNCQILTEGFDEPSIDGIVMARPTRSRSLFLQMMGRGLRTFKGKKNCKIIDIVDNHKNLVGFNSVIEEEKYPEILSFKKIDDIYDHIEKEKIKIEEYRVEKINLLDRRMINEKMATQSMKEYLCENKIKFYEPISFDEGSFLIWMNELKKEYEVG